MYFIALLLVIFGHFMISIGKYVDPSSSIVVVKIDCKDPPACDKSVLVINKKGTSKKLIPSIKLSKKNQKKPKTRSVCKYFYKALEPTLESIQKNEIVALEMCPDGKNRGLVTSKNQTIRLIPDSKNGTRAIKTVFDSKNIFSGDSVIIDRELIKKTREKKMNRMKFGPRKSSSNIFEIETLALVDKTALRADIPDQADSDDLLRKNIESSFTVAAQMYNDTGFRPVLKKIIMLENKEYYLDQSEMSQVFDTFFDKIQDWQNKIPEWKDYDLIIWFTYKKEDYVTLGIAAQDTMCSQYSAAFVQLFKYETAFLLTHEIGHTLHLLHDDGKQTKCNDRHAIMYYKYGSFEYWSQCSREKMKEYQASKDETVTGCMKITSFPSTSIEVSQQ